MTKTPETSMKILWMLLLTLCARTTLGVLNNVKPTKTTSTNDGMERDELQVVASNLVGYQYTAPSVNNNDLKHYASTSDVNTAFHHPASHINRNYSLAHTSATLTPSYHYPHPTAAPLTEPPSHYYLPSAAFTPTPTPLPSQQKLGHQLGYNYAAAPATYHASFSMGGWPLYQHSSPANALAASLQDDIKQQQKLLSDAPSFFVPQNGKGPKIGGNTNSYQTQSFPVPRLGKKQPNVAVEVETNDYQPTSHAQAQTHFAQHSHGYDYERPTSAEIEAQDSFRQPLKTPTSNNVLPQSTKWPQLHRFVPQEGVAAATKTENLTTALKSDITKAPNHNYQATSTPTIRPSYGPPHDIASDAASARKPTPQFNGADTYGSQIRVLQQLHTSVQPQQTQQQHISAPSEAPLDSFESYLNYRLQLQNQQQQLQAQAQRQQTPTAGRFDFAHTAYPATKPASPFPQSQQITSQGIQSPATFPASTLEVPNAAPVGDFAVQTSALAAATFDPHAGPLEPTTAKPIEQQNFGFSTNQHFNLNRPINFETRNAFSGHPTASTLLSGERYNPYSVRAGSDFLQMQSESYELPTYSYYAMEAAVPSRELSIGGLDGQQPAAQQQTQATYAFGNAAIRQPHAVYGAPTLPSSAARADYSI